MLFFKFAKNIIPYQSITQCLYERTAYATEGSKTASGELISSYECDPVTAAAGFAFDKREYFIRTGRSQEHDIIAYQIRQSFKPDEVTAEEANRIGYEFAERFLKGKHAFIVCTHINRRHIHNHIVRPDRVLHKAVLRNCSVR